MKKFRDLEIGEPLYYIDPQDRQIKETTIIQSFLHPKSKNKKVWVLKSNVTLRLPKVPGPETFDFMRASRTKNIEHTFMVNADESLQIVLAKVPTAICTEKDYLTTWMTRTYLRKKL